MLLERPVTRDGLIIRLIDGECAVYDAHRDSVSLLNASAGAILAFCDGSRSVREIVHDLADAFDTAEEHVIGHVQSSLEQFQAMGLIDGGTRD